MTKVHLICGKICSGKSTYAQKLAQERNAVVLSCDELMLALFDPLLGDKHDEIAAKARDYLFKMAERIVRTGTEVILDWGFWTAKGRKEAAARIEKMDAEPVWHYLRTEESEWRRRIEKRNREVLARQTQAYYLDEGLMKKAEMLFEEPPVDAWDIQNMQCADG